MQTLEFPYAGTSGWAGSETSRERAEQQDQDGTFSKRQKQTMQELWQVGSMGLTWRELAFTFNLHHGQASGVLSVLHKAEKISRLEERRNRCAVYVLPEFVNGRETSQHANTKAGGDKAKLEKIRKLHVPSEELIWSIEERKDIEYCNECQYRYPCDTIQIVGLDD
jgi:hypothetical protein